MRKSSKFFQPQPMRSARGVKLSFVAAILLVVGCSHEPLSGTEGYPAVAEPSVVQNVEAAVPATPAEPTEPLVQTYSQKLAAALERASAAKNAVVDQLSAAGESGGQAANDSVVWAAEMFHSLKEQGLTKAENTQEWLANDWKHAGAWEYKILTFGSDDNAGTKLNELGAERWECFHVTKASGGSPTFYLKRPAQSYLNSLPMKDLMHLLPLMGSGRPGE